MGRGFVNVDRAIKLSTTVFLNGSGCFVSLKHLFAVCRLAELTQGLVPPFGTNTGTVGMLVLRIVQSLLFVFYRLVYVFISTVFM